MTGAPGTAPNTGPDTGGPLMFVRYAYPPNALGYCGPADFAAFREYAVAGVVDRGLVQLAQAFAGAWPYLELIAAGCGIGDPLDRRVVEAYWVGNDLLDRVPVTEIGDSMQDRFRHRVGRNFPFLAEGVLAGGVPHHSFAVFCVYPWTGLLGDDRKARHALMVLDRCRIRWGRVTAIAGDQATVEYRPLCWDGRLLTLGEPGDRDGPAGPGRFGSADVRRPRHRPGRLGLTALGLDLRPARPSASSAPCAASRCATWTWSTTASSIPGPSPSSADRPARAVAGRPAGVSGDFQAERAVVSRACIRRAATGNVC